jgi:hypothetical protein
MEHPHQVAEKTSLKSYLPLMVVAAYILGGTAILSRIVPGTDWMRGIMFFEGLMLALFALFKLLDVKGFQEGYSTYDLVTRKVPAWGYAYPFVELGLGMLLLLGLWLMPVSIAVAALAVIGLVSVTIELRKGRKFQCACLGTALNVPLTKVTLVENGIMLVLAIIMIANFLGVPASNGMPMAGDRQFLEHMVPHHQEAVDSSRVVAARTEDPEVKRLAEAIIAAQTEEISEMKGWHKRWYGKELQADSSYAPMMAGYEAVPLQELDDRYLSDMIAHHEGAIVSASEFKDRAERVEVKGLIEEIIQTQQREIEEMRKMVEVPVEAAAHNMH